LTILLFCPMAKEAGVAMDVSSAGTWAEIEHGMYPETAACAKRHNLDGSGHVSRQLTPDLVEAADIVVALDGTAMPIVERMALSRGAELTFLSRPALNPWGMEPHAHEQTYNQIVATCGEVLADSARTTTDASRLRLS
jgi:protein-tyrosine-phosphatase